MGKMNIIITDNDKKKNLFCFFVLSFCLFFTYFFFSVMRRWMTRENQQTRMLHRQLKATQFSRIILFECALNHLTANTKKNKQQEKQKTKFIILYNILTPKNNNKKKVENKNLPSVLKSKMQSQKKNNKKNMKKKFKCYK